MKNTVERVKSRREEPEEQISVIEDRELQSNLAEEQREKGVSNNEKMLRDLYDNSKWKNSCIIRVP